MFDRKQKKRDKELEKESRKRARRAAEAEDEKLFGSDGDMSEGADFMN